MRAVNLSRDAEKFLRRVPEKHRVQLARKLLALVENPRPNDAKKLVDSAYLRVTVGEYRVVYGITGDAIEVVLLDKRDKVYKALRRL